MATAPSADTLRIATYDAELNRKGTGLMLAAIGKDDPQVIAVAGVIARARPDILLLLGVDLDHKLHGAKALRDKIAEQGHVFQHVIAMSSNRGLATGVDLDGDGRSWRAADSQGFGWFTGQNGMVILSRYPAETADAVDHSALLWHQLPDAQMPVHNNAPFPSAEAHRVLRLASNGHWMVPFSLPGGEKITLLTMDATPPVFDGPEDSNGLRNAAEVGFWQMVLDGQIGTPPKGPFVMLGNANIDPEKGDGKRHAIRALLSDPRLQDPRPLNASGSTATVDWPDPVPGDMRVDYVLPSASLQVTGAGVLWPKGKGALEVKGTRPSRHHLVWVDVTLP